MNISFNSNAAGLMNLKARRQKFGIGSLIVMLIIGVAFIGIGKTVLKSMSVNSSWTRVTGKVISVSAGNTSGSTTTYAPIVQYTANGQQYQVSSSVSSSSYPQIGTPKQVAYDPSNPGDAKVINGVGTTWFVYIFPIVGIIMVVGSPILFVRSMRRSHDIKGLQQTGVKLQGVLTDVLQVGQTNQGGSAYKMIVSATNQAGQVQAYTSDTIHGMGGITLAHFQSHPIPIDVYVNPSNPKDYYVDISDIPSLTPEKISELIQQTMHPMQANTFANSEQPAQPVVAQPASPIQFTPQAAPAPAAPTVFPGTSVAPVQTPSPEPVAAIPATPPSDIVSPTPPSDSVPPTPQQPQV